MMGVIKGIGRYFTGEHEVVNDVGAETGHEIRTTIGGQNGQSRQTVSYIAEHVVGTGSFSVVFQAKSKPETLLPSRKFFKTSATRTGNCRLCKCWIILISSH
ncbi:hypothetical protein CsatA_025843 [Cannabis sativa]